jgi:hypothetical protein
VVSVAVSQFSNPLAEYSLDSLSDKLYYSRIGTERFVVGVRHSMRVDSNTVVCVQIFV